MIKQGYSQTIKFQKEYERYSMEELNKLVVQYLREYQNTGNEFMLGSAYAVVAIIDDRK